MATTAAFSILILMPFYWIIVLCTVQSQPQLQWIWTTPQSHGIQICLFKMPAATRAHGVDYYHQQLHYNLLSTYTVRHITRLDFAIDSDVWSGLSRFRGHGTRRTHHFAWSGNTLDAFEFVIACCKSMRHKQVHVQTLEVKVQQMQEQIGEFVLGTITPTARPLVPGVATTTAATTDSIFHIRDIHIPIITRLSSISTANQWWEEEPEEPALPRELSV